jgi:hypothetical protein
MSILLLIPMFVKSNYMGYQVNVCEELPKAVLKNSAMYLCKLSLLVTINGELPVRHPESLSMNHIMQMLGHNTATFQCKMKREISNRCFFFIMIIHAHSHTKHFVSNFLQKTNKLCGLSLQANYTNRATATCRRS